VAGTCGYGLGLSGSINAGNFLTTCKDYWLAFQEVLCSMELVNVSYVSLVGWLMFGLLVGWSASQSVS